MPSEASSRAVLDFYFDFVSPYAYLGWTQIHALAERHGRTVRPVPVLFAAMLKHNGTLGPAEIPAKRRYIYLDTLRTARALGVPFAPPPAHPFNPLAALRAATVTPDVIAPLFAAAWGGGGGGGGGGGVERIDHLVPADVLAASTTEPIKAQLRAATEAAIARGVFGVPTVIADGELFWGVDALPHLERFLAGADPITADDRARLAALAPSAERPR